MSTFLELVQELHVEVGAAGSPPATVVKRTGEAARLVKYIARADLFIQNLYENWKFKRNTYDQNTTSDQISLPVALDASFWDEESFKIYDANGNNPWAIEVVEHEDVKNEVRDDNTNQPYRVIIMPDNTLEVECTPDNAYRVTSDYYVAPEEMTADADVSLIPARFHVAILGRAMILYGNYEDAPEMVKQGQDIYGETLMRLENHQLPNKHNSRYRTGARIEVIASQ